MKNYSKTYIIAEAGVNHNGSLKRAKDMIDCAAASGADAVKFQTFKSEKVISKFAVKAEYQEKTTGTDESQLEMVKKLELDESAHKELLAYCKERHIKFLSTPFDEESVDLLVEVLHVNKLKIPSGEITNGPLLLKAALTGLPLIVSTGMATLEEVEQALGVIAYGYIKPYNEGISKKAFKEAYKSFEGQKVLKEKVVLLHCTTEYPAPFSDVNLLAMDTLKNAFGLPVGYSDHTPGIIIPVAAVARGAVVIEKHFTLDRNLPGPDHKASIEPRELIEMVQAIRNVETALGTSIKAPASSELKNIPIARKSLVASRTIKIGEVFSSDNMTVKRPGNGISPMSYWEFLGKKAERDYEEDEVIV